MSKVLGRHGGGGGGGGGGKESSVDRMTGPILIQICNHRLATKWGFHWKFQQFKLIWSQ